MSKKQINSDTPLFALKSESARQRWELFHRAIAHAKESNQSTLTDADTHGGGSDGAGPLLSIVR